MNLVFRSTTTGKTQGNGAFTVTLSGDDYKPSLRTYAQVTVEPGTSTTGTVAITATPYPTTSAEAVRNTDGTALEISLVDSETVEFSAAVTSITFTPTGADGTYNVYVTAWQTAEQVRV